MKILCFAVSLLLGIFSSGCKFFYVHTVDEDDAYITYLKRGHIYETTVLSFLETNDDAPFSSTRSYPRLIPIQQIWRINGEPRIEWVEQNANNPVWQQVKKGEKGIEFYGLFIKTGEWTRMILVLPQGTRLKITEFLRMQPNGFSTNDYASGIVFDGPPKGEKFLIINYATSYYDRETREYVRWLKDLGPAPPVSKEEGDAERFPTGFTQEAQIY